MHRSLPRRSSRLKHISEKTVEQSSEIVPVSQLATSIQMDIAAQAQANTAPLILLPGQYMVGTTGQLIAISGSTGDIPTAPSLIAALQATMSPSQTTTGRLTVIPGARKRLQITEKVAVPARRMKPRLRHSIVLGTLLLVVVTTLISLAPLDNGQSIFPFVRNISSWVQSQAGNLLFDAQVAPTPVAASNGADMGNQPPAAPAPPPMALPKSQYVAIAQQDAVAAGISPDYFVRQINQESGFNPNAVSPAGAVGIAQFEPSTAAGLGINPWDPIQALRAAANMMAGYSKNYGGNYAMALAAYNGGTGTVQYAVNTCGASNWMNCLPWETRTYIRVIMGI